MKTKAKPSTTSVRLTEIQAFWLSRVRSATDPYWRNWGLVFGKQLTICRRLAAMGLVEEVDPRAFRRTKLGDACAGGGERG